MKITDICDKHDVPILVHCKTGGRASLSAHTLQTMGYSNVHAIVANYDDIKMTFG
jgi:rhodanese-related sulfurtransferase